MNAGRTPYKPSTTNPAKKLDDDDIFKFLNDDTPYQPPQKVVVKPTKPKKETKHAKKPSTGGATGATTKVNGREDEQVVKVASKVASPRAYHSPRAQMESDSNGAPLPSNDNASLPTTSNETSPSTPERPTSPKSPKESPEREPETTTQQDSVESAAIENETNESQDAGPGDQTGSGTGTSEGIPEGVPAGEEVTDEQPASADAKEEHESDTGVVVAGNSPDQEEQAQEVPVKEEQVEVGGEAEEEEEEVEEEEEDEQDELVEQINTLTADNSKLSRENRLYL